MNNVSNLGLANGFAQGFTLMNNYQAGKEARERADKTFQRQESEWARADAGRITEAMYEGVMSGNIDPEIAKQFEAKTGHINWTDFIDPEYGESLRQMGSILSGNGSVNTPEGIKAVNRIYDKEIKRGVGEKSGNKVIVDKKVNRVMPSKDGKSFMLNLGVTEEDPEQGWSVRNAPVTGPNRSVSDTEVKQIPLEQALSDLKGKTMVYEAIQKSPELIALIKQRAARLGAQLPQEEKRYGGIEQVQGLGMVQQGPNGQINVLRPEDKPEGLKTTVINGKLVNSQTGEEIANHGKPEKPEKPIVTAGGLVLSPDGTSVVADHRKAGGSGKGSGSGLDSSSISQVQQISKNFHGSFNPDGSFLGIPEGSRERYTESMKRTETLIHAGYPLFAAANIANLSTLDPLTPEKASQIAEKEASDRDISGSARNTFIKNRSMELMEKQNEAHNIYNNLFAPDPEEQATSSSAPYVDTMQGGLNVGSGVVDRNNAVPDPRQSQNKEQAKPARQATPQDEQKLKALLGKASGNREAIEKIKDYYIGNFGSLPKGM